MTFPLEGMIDYKENIINHGFKIWWYCTEAETEMWLCQKHINFGPIDHSDYCRLSNQQGQVIDNQFQF